MILLIDHYDSYTNNLAHLFGKLADVRVVRCEEGKLLEVSAAAAQ